MLLLRQQNETSWRSPSVMAYPDEAALQALIKESPERLPGSNSGSMAVATEFGLATGYLDVVGVDPAGTITLVECRLKANPEIRRQVVG